MAHTMARPRGNPSAVGSTPELLQHIATFVQHGPALFRLVDALPADAKSPAMAALSALRSTPTICVDWPRITVLASTSEATKQHLANIDALGAIVAMGAQATSAALLHERQSVLHCVEFCTLRASTLSEATALGGILAACRRLRIVSSYGKMGFAAVAEIFSHLPLGQLTELTLRGNHPASVASNVAAMLVHGRCRRLHLVDSTFGDMKLEDSLRDLVFKNDIGTPQYAVDVHACFMEQQLLPRNLRRVDLELNILAKCADHITRYADPNLRPGQRLAFEDCSAADIASFRMMLLSAERLAHFTGRLLVHVANEPGLYPSLGRLTSLCMPLSGQSPDVWPARFLRMLPHLASLKHLELQYAAVCGDFQRELTLGLVHCTKLQYLYVSASSLDEALWLAHLPCPKLDALRVRFPKCASSDLVRLIKGIAAAPFTLRWLCVEKESWPKGDRARNIKTLAAANIALEYVSHDVNLYQQRRSYNYWDVQSTNHTRLVVFVYEGSRVSV
ncbi:hypothetical protein SPRG_17585 [Saprolegnia parasitica CBS 223.65]|uniref:F-box domain-containing protein n=1 Tax=Saprolegnia parasitica (strain CBS 223.65) TaxID=695850 RepID=A0A067BRM6_SAPPC|nr:hypothetical protein SPRG_17585 [Saprolegnia parasitica CBS 223.65]KDO16961.1 hypothetical protein SPRG_17585 [Saprolegnia parasitica CBS 223.65]|eukprot:XP_012212331.1 hypothetical protein SPRG_17585 [Saprolegnia parasitica CBS 223.65]